MNNTTNLYPIFEDATRANPHAVYDEMRAGIIRSGKV